MGVNISIYTADGKEWPEWDWSRHAGDREFHPDDDLPSEQVVLSRAGPWIEDVGFRPVDFEKWRARFAGPEAENAERYAVALDFLEANPGSYVYYGI